MVSDRLHDQHEADQAENDGHHTKRVFDVDQPIAHHMWRRYYRANDVILWHVPWVSATVSVTLGSNPSIRIDRYQAMRDHLVIALVRYDFTDFVLAVSDHYRTFGRNRR